MALIDPLEPSTPPSFAPSSGKPAWIIPHTASLLSPVMDDVREASIPFTRAIQNLLADPLAADLSTAASPVTTGGAESRAYSANRTFRGRSNVDVSVWKFRLIQSPRV